MNSKLCKLFAIYDFSKLFINSISFKNFFYIIIDSKKFAELGVHPSGEAFKKLPVEFKNNIPSFINQNVNLKRLENVR